MISGNSVTGFKMSNYEIHDRTLKQPLIEPLKLLSENFQPMLEFQTLLCRFIVHLDCLQIDNFVNLLLLPSDIITNMQYKLSLDAK